MSESLPSAQSDSGTAERAFALIDTLLDVQLQTPVEIIPHHILRRATAEEVEKIRTKFAQYGDVMGLKSLRYEGVTKASSGTASFSERSANPDDWRYWVIGIADDLQGSINGGICAIEEASRLTAVELECRLFFFSPGENKRGFFGGDHMYMGAGGTMGLTLDFESAVPRFGPAELEEVRLLCRQIPIVTASHERVRLAIANYLRLRQLPRREPMYVLGVFSVIESLLTHDPKGGYDSLGHQMKTKISLLNRRFRTPLNYEEFGGEDPKKTWSKLYAYRSCIAHGSQPDFAKDLRSLKDAQHATRFVDTAAKAVIKQALQEPDLVADLQAC